MLSRVAIPLTVLVCFVEVGICPAKLQKLVTSQHLLDLFVVQFSETPKFVILKSKRLRSFKSGQSIVFELIIVSIIQVCLIQWMVLIRCQFLIIDLFIPLAIKSCLDLFDYCMVCFCVPFGIDTIELPVTASATYLWQILPAYLALTFAFGILSRDRKLPFHM